MIVTPQQQRRYAAFWNREPVDRACMYIAVGDKSHSFPEPVSVSQKWEDLDYREKKAVYDTAHTWYFGEGFPSTFVNFGPGSLAACIGGTHAFAPNTVWFENKPFFVSEWESRPSPKYNPDAPMSQLVEALTDRYLRHGDQFITSITDIGGTYDIIAALRGTENLLYDMYDAPEAVKAFRDEVAPLWKAYFLRHSQRLIAEQGGMTSWMPIWSETPYYPLQCDYCAMLSPAMFREFVLPDLEAQTQFMDRAVYHLDGPDEICHLDMILSLPGINAIQWTSGAGNPPLSDPCWFDLYRRIQAAGKGLVLLGLAPGEVEAVFGQISQRGVFAWIDAQDAQEADEVLRMAEKLNH